VAETFHVTNAPFGEVVYQYDDSFEGLLTAVFDSYRGKQTPIGIVGQQHQKRLDAQYVNIETDNAKAERVINGINRVMGGNAYEKVWTGFLSCNPDKGNIIYKYIRFGMKKGYRIHQLLTHRWVMDMDKLAKPVGRESSLMIEFIRFSCMEGGVYYGKIEPENHVISLMMPFFVDRFNSQPFIIHDSRHQIAGVYDTREWFIRSAEGLTMPDYSEDEMQYRALWKRFYNTIAIKERINPGLRRQHMPKKYWRHITEMTMTDNAPPTALPSDISRAQIGDRFVRASPYLQDRSSVQISEEALYLPTGGQTPTI
jgi:probable DNA metabolism protein